MKKGGAVQSGTSRLNAIFITRVRIAVLLCVLIAAVLIGRLYQLQILDGETYAARAQAQYEGPKSGALLNRHSIYFTSKEGNLITAATLQKVEGKAERKRFYPGGSLAAHALGFVAYNNDDTERGRYGLERYWDQTLQKEEKGLYTNFFVELFSAARAVLGGGTRTGDLITTLEPSVQTQLERTLEKYESEWNPELVGGIIMDPRSGEIVAMAVAPAFDLNSFKTQKNVRIFSNPLVEGVYEMGSIIKPLTVAGGIDSGAISAATTYNDTGKIVVDGKPISNFDGRARGVVSMQEVLSQSLNLGVSFISTRMGSSTMREYFLKRYKFGEETGIDLPAEAHGLVGNLSSPRLVEYNTASFGQGIALTPIATVRALAVLANGGMLVTPHLTRAIKGEGGTRPVVWSAPERVLEQKTALEVSRMLTKVVDEALLDGKYKRERYSIAAKTGTAQIANPGGGGYYEDRFLHSFFGYFPSYDARFIVFLFALEPKGASYASQTLAEPFYILSEFLINYYAIPPDR